MGKKKLINAENYVVSFPLLTEKWQEDILDQRFELLRKIYNALQSKWQKKYTYVTQMKAYKECQTLTERSDFFKTYEVPFMNNGGKQISIAPFKGAYGMTTYVAKFASQYNKYGINSSILEDIANCCWSSWDKLIYHKGKKIHFKRKGEINSYKIRIKSERFNGIDKDELNNQRLVININGKIKGLAKTITIPFYVNPKSAYEMYAFMDKITCIAVKREVIRGKNRYFVQFTFEGKKPSKNRKLGEGNVGIDLGPSIVAVSSDKKVYLDELATNVDNIEQKLRRIQRKLDRSRRANSPGNFNPNGTVRKPKNGEKLRWKLSNHYFKDHRKLIELYRKQAVMRKRCHIDLANYLLTFGKHFVVENNDIQSWAKLTKEAKLKENGRFSSRHRYGRAIGNKAPAMLIEILGNKVMSLGGTLEKIDCHNAASQFDFTDGSFTHHGLGVRRIQLSNGNIHQRDMLAAFNLQHLLIDGCKKDKDNYDVKGMIYDYENFYKMEQAELNRHRNSNKKVLSTMGIK